VTESLSGSGGQIEVVLMIESLFPGHGAKEVPFCEGLRLAFFVGAVIAPPEFDINIACLLWGRKLLTCNGLSRCVVHRRHPATGGVAEKAAFHNTGGATWSARSLVLRKFGDMCE
jgi:hypothetical protein